MIYKAHLSLRRIYFNTNWLQNDFIGMGWDGVCMDTTSNTPTNRYDLQARPWVVSLLSVSGVSLIAYE